MVTVSGNSNPTNPTYPTNPTTINSGELTDKNRLGYSTYPNKTRLLGLYSDICELEDN